MIKVHIQNVHKAGRDFSVSHLFWGKRLFFKRENTLFIKRTPFFNTFANYFHWREEPEIFAWKLPHPKVDRVLVLLVVNFELDLAPNAPPTGPFNPTSAVPTKSCTVNSIQHTTMGQLIRTGFHAILIG